MEDTIKSIVGILVFLFIVFCVTDCTVGSKRFCPGVVRHHVYHPPYTTLSCSHSKYGTHCHTVHHAAQYHLLIACDQPEHVADVDAGAWGYVRYSDNDRVIVGEKMGRWTKIIWSNWIERRQDAQDY